MIYLLRIYKYL